MSAGGSPPSPEPTVMGRPGVAAASALGSVGCAAGMLGVKLGDRKQVAKDRCQAGQ